MATGTQHETTRRMVLTAAAACEDKKAGDTRILELDPADSGFTDFFLIASGTNERQTQAIADEVELRLKREYDAYPNSVEGRRLGEWILMDYVDFVIHIFLAERRAFYDIERLRKSARTVDVEELKAALTKRLAAARKKASAVKEAATAKRAVAKKAVAKKAGAKAPATKQTATKKAVNSAEVAAGKGRKARVARKKASSPAPRAE